MQQRTTKLGTNKCACTDKQLCAFHDPRPLNDVTEGNSNSMPTREENAARLQQDEDTYSETLSPEERRAVDQLRHRGFAVIIWTPEELDGATPSKVEDRSV